MAARPERSLRDEDKSCCRDDEEAWASIVEVWGPVDDVREAEAASGLRELNEDDEEMDRVPRRSWEGRSLRV